MWSRGAKKLSSLDAPMADPARSLPVPESSTSSPVKSLSLDEMVAVLNMALARADATTVMNTLGIIARERGMSQIARESLYRSLDANENPEFANASGTPHARQIAADHLWRSCAATNDRDSMMESGLTTRTFR